jgi:hypothetical protein
MPQPPPIASSNDAYATWHFNRGSIDICLLNFTGALAEFQAAQQYAPTSADVLFNIGATYQFLADPSNAVTWYQQCVNTKDPTYAKIASFRISQIEREPANVTIFTEPHTEPDPVVITLTPAGSQQSVQKPMGKEFFLPPGTYHVHVERPNYLPQDQDITLGYGQAYSFSWQLTQRTGEVAIELTEPGAHIETLTIDNYLANRVGPQPVGPHQLFVKATGYYPATVPFTVTGTGVTRVKVPLKELPTSGRWEFIMGSAIAGGTAGWLGVETLTNDCAGQPAAAMCKVVTVSPNTQAAAIGAGAVVGGAGSFVATRDGINLGSTAFILGNAAFGGIDGAALADTAKRFDFGARAGFAAGGIAVGYAAGAVVAGKYHPSAGKALLYDSIAAWSIGTGFMLDNALETDHPNRGPILLIATNVGLVGAALLAPRYDWSVEHVLVVNACGLAGLLLGAGAEFVATDAHLDRPNTGDPSTDAKVQAQHRAALELTGSLAGLTLGTIGFWNYDESSPEIEEETGPLASPSTAPTSPTSRSGIEIGMPTPVIAPDVGPAGQQGERYELTVAGRF